MIDAPTHLPDGTATVALDSTGRLLALSVPPGITESAHAAMAAGDVDWSPLFERSQLNPDHAMQITPITTPSIVCDTVVAWRVDSSSENQEPVTVLMGAVGGKPNYFEYVGLHDDMLPNHALFQGNVNVIGFCWMVFNGFMILLACRNLRAGRADHRNAFRCALLIGGLYATQEVVSIAVGGSDAAGRVIGLTNGRAAGHFLLHAIEAWLYYLAIEPYVRRVWPRMLIGLVRVFSGCLRDPAIGREVLIGLVTGCLLVAGLTLVAAADWRITADNSAHLANPLSLRIIMSPGHYLSNRAHYIAWAVLAGVSYAGVVVLIRLLVRHAITSAGLSIAVIGLLEFGLYFMNAGDSLWAAFIHAIGVGACLVWLYTKVGVLAAIVFFFVMRSMGLFGLAFDAWSTPYLLAWLAILFALAAYGFWVSLAGQPIFKDMLAEHQAV
jgi:hypothetical protein